MFALWMKRRTLGELKRMGKVNIYQSISKSNFVTVHTMGENHFQF